MTRSAPPWPTALLVLALGTLPAHALGMLVFWRFGRELETGYDREYEQEPPAETEPAHGPPLRQRGGEATGVWVARWRRDRP